MAAIRGRSAGRLRFALGGQQDLARILVTSIAALGVGVSTVAGTGTAVVSPQTHASAQPVAAQVRTPATAPSSSAAGRQVTVQAPTTVWKLAETYLGDGGRWQEILDLNRGAAMSDGIPLTQATQTLPAGSTLRLPAKAAPHPHTETTPDGLYTVVPNDTLWDIAEETLDDPTRYTEVFAASTDTVQPGGQRLVDPDHIEPGWTLTIPDTDPPSEGRPTSHGRRHRHLPPNRASETTGTQPIRRPPTKPPQERHNTGPKDSTQIPEVTPEAEPPATQPEAAATTVDTATEREGQDGITALRALLASAACLSAGALIMLTASRRRQFRERRSGRSVAAAPPELARVERAVVEAGTEALETTEFIDLALRHLAACRRVSGSGCRTLLPR